ncbi:beta strand repeat-containing protein [Spirosoma sp. KNUC1025]|uniref:beta strand repeat-containing protein n=1 Tax=Spirosoma sp. KNUC1025 TaxID=2894082 RepID=UPI00386A09FE|nr:hypothetical protein LN737_15635 [Spirosoma sp. KNUC1025]
MNQVYIPDSDRRIQLGLLRLGRPNSFSLPESTGYITPVNKNILVRKKDRKSLSTIGLLLLLSCLLTFSQANANTFTVTNTGDNGGVNPAANAGTGTLRQAIIDANANAGADIINFAITPLGGVKTITLSAFLPPITGQTTINGYSQSGASQGVIGSRTITIEINGGNTNTTVSGNSLGIFNFSATSDNSSLSGIALYNSGNAAVSIIILPSADNVQIWGNYIGLLASGFSPGSSSLYNKTDGVLLANSAGGSGAYSGVIIGTNGDGNNDANEGNVISNSSDGTNGGDGIQIGFNTTDLLTYSGVRISGNYIGLAADGVTLAPNGGANPGVSSSKGQDGIDLRQGIDGISGNPIIIGTNGDGVSDALERNVISGNSGSAISVGSNIDYVRISGNYIGTDKTGTVAKPNGTNSTTAGTSFSGILAFSGCTNIVVGFDDAVHVAAVAADVRNVISGNYSDGITFVSMSGAGNKISGNYIGSDVTGNAALSNGSGSIDQSSNGSDGHRSNNITLNSSSAITIGTDGDNDDDAIEANVIVSANNGYGIHLRHTATTGTTVGSNIIAGNKIGVGADGTTALGNDRGGIIINISQVSPNASSYNNANRIGSNNDNISDDLEANIIAYNGTSATTALQRGEL